MDALRKVKYGDLTTDQRELADLVGWEVFLNLVEKCGGLNLYIPKAESVGRAARNATIKAEFTGGNIKGLAAKFQLSEVQIRAILTQKRCE